MATDNSVITNYRREQLAKATGGAIPSVFPITKIAFGDGGVDAGGNPIPPLGTATALGHELARYTIDGVTWPIPTTSRYVASIPALDLPGASISEAALVDGDGKLCAIKTMYVKKKDAGVTFTFTFDDEF